MKCGVKIKKGTLRIAVSREFQDPRGNMRTGAGYLHPACAKDWEGVTLDAVKQNSPHLNKEQKQELEATL
jgi:hypothetical protein